MSDEYVCVETTNDSTSSTYDATIGTENGDAATVQTTDSNSAVTTGATTAVGTALSALMTVAYVVV